MPVVKVSCLPADLTEEKLRDIHRSIVAEAVGMTEFGIKDETWMTTLFPADMMKYGLGTEIIIEVISDMFYRFNCSTEQRNKFARGMVRAVKKFFPDAMVECFILDFARSKGFYNCPAGEMVPDEK